jgi:hypothetical protein
VADVDPAFEQQILHVPQRQRKAIHRHRQADNLGRGVKATKRAGGNALDLRLILRCQQRPTSAAPLL